MGRISQGSCGGTLISLLVGEWPGGVGIQFPTLLLCGPLSMKLQDLQGKMTGPYIISFL